MISGLLRKSIGMARRRAAKVKVGQERLLAEQTAWQIKNRLVAKLELDKQCILNTKDGQVICGDDY